MNSLRHRKQHFRRGFSLVELLIVLVILGVVMFLAIPNIVQVRSDSEDNLAPTLPGRGPRR